jgi:hypothetical protein
MLVTWVSHPAEVGCVHWSSCGYRMEAPSVRYMPQCPRNASPLAFHCCGIIFWGSSSSMRNYFII